MPDLDDDDINAYLDDEPDSGDDPTAAQQDSTVINDFRKRERALKADLKKARDELETVRPFRDKYLTSQAPKVLEEAGVDPSLFKLFVKDNASTDLTPELAKTWAAENGIQIKEAEPQTAAAEGTFAPTVGGDAPGPKLIDRGQIDQMMKDGRQAEALRLINSGRVQFNNPDVLAR